MLRDTLTEVGFESRNLPEEVAFSKVVEQSLDCVADRGYLTMGYLRDGISRNNLKLPDVSSAREIVSGDRLLKADDQLDVTLDGVYHRGEFYLRWLQVISSLAFGTDRGRFFTKYIAIPFGGALLIVEGVRYLLSHLFRAKEQVVTSQVRDGVQQVVEKPVESHTLPANPTEWMEFATPVLVVGLFLMALIHMPRFREASLGVLKKLRKGFALVVYRAANEATAMGADQRLSAQSGLPADKPLGSDSRDSDGNRLLCSSSDLANRNTSGKLRCSDILLVSLFVNSRLGRDVEELTLEWFSLRWYQLRAHVFVAFVDWTVEAFAKMLELVERFLYAIDECCATVVRESPVTLAFKAVLGVVWSLIDFIIRFCVNLLIEPQVNPIKHFPVVTVSHKLLLPTVPAILGPVLDPFLGTETATALAVVVATVLPGVFGFLVWELKENWRLYEANHSDKMAPVAVGGHGETMLRLLKPGFHSGTLPKTVPQASSA